MDDDEEEEEDVPEVLEVEDTDPLVGGEAAAFEMECPLDGEDGDDTPLVSSGAEELSFIVLVVVVVFSSSLGLALVPVVLGMSLEGASEDSGDEVESFDGVSSPEVAEESLGALESLEGASSLEEESSLEVVSLEVMSSLEVVSSLEVSSLEVLSLEVSSLEVSSLEVSSLEVASLEVASSEESESDVEEPLEEEVVSSEESGVETPLEEASSELSSLEVFSFAFSSSSVFSLFSVVTSLESSFLSTGSPPDHLFTIPSLSEPASPSPLEVSGFFFSEEDSIDHAKLSAGFTYFPLRCTILPQAAEQSLSDASQLHCALI